MDERDVMLTRISIAGEERRRKIISATAIGGPGELQSLRLLLIEAELHLSWMSANMKWREDDIKQNLLPEVPDDYSTSLTAVLDFIAVIEKENSK